MASVSSRTFGICPESEARNAEGSCLLLQATEDVVEPAILRRPLELAEHTQRHPICQRIWRICRSVPMAVPNVRRPPADSRSVERQMRRERVLMRWLSELSRDRRSSPIGRSVCRPPAHLRERSRLSLTLRWLLQVCGVEYAPTSRAERT